MLFDSTIGPNQSFNTRFIGNKFRLIKEPKSGLNKTVSWIPHVLQVADLLIYISEYIANVHNNYTILCIYIYTHTLSNC